jgi:primosomal replication protein N
VENRVVLSACIAQAEALRYTPGGLPAVTLQLEHESQQLEAGQTREVKAALKAVAFGPMAERLAGQALGSCWVFSGFLATPRNGKHAVFHIQDIQQNSFSRGP